MGGVAETPKVWRRFQTSIHAFAPYWTLHAVDFPFTDIIFIVRIQFR